ncbi:hypothetical protein E5Q_02102 [Mixia osmundae IAM 14324]|uniref:DUF924-domain-containing protein n=1 Tax=Mixia osmundae (strain CBS 9802 / IAM 14324 / JCM 22182 / KY 12970) TaxID=764103 RepID=G7DXY8_MIXOS|nr:hypothetical protein E5Q_02102 [Mixia osmundae IAM 14324]
MLGSILRASLAGGHLCQRASLGATSIIRTMTSPTNQLATPDDVWSYWFVRDNHLQTFFGRPDGIDDDIRARFSSTLEAIKRDESLRARWQTTPRDTLSLIVTLDQFSRNMYRGTSTAFEGDALCRDIVRAGLARKVDKELSRVERMFVYLPIMHHEDLESQEDIVRLSEQLAKDKPDEKDESFIQQSGFPASEVQTTLEQAAHYAKLHRDVIRRFGRYPGRNEALGRTSTEEELHALANEKVAF